MIVEPKIGDRVSPRETTVLSNGLILSPEAVGVVTFIETPLPYENHVWDGRRFTINFELATGIIYKLHLDGGMQFSNAFRLRDRLETPDIPGPGRPMSRYEIALKKKRNKNL